MSRYVEAAWNNTHGAKSTVGRVDITAKLLGGCSPPVRGIVKKKNETYEIYYTIKFFFTYALKTALARRGKERRDKTKLKKVWCVVLFCDRFLLCD